MDRKAMCVAICVLIVLSALLWVLYLALGEAAGQNPADKKHVKLQRAAVWCKELALGFAVVSFLLVLCCHCCKGVEFDAPHGVPSVRSVRSGVSVPSRSAVASGYE